MRIIALVFLLLITGMHLPGQSPRDLAFAKSLVANENGGKRDWTSVAGDGAGIFGTMAGGMFLFYKAFVSSQDYRRCSFTVSCSEYAMRAVRRYGFFAGLVRGLDRYSRCTGRHPEFYPHDPHRHRLIDPVR